MNNSNTDADSITWSDGIGPRGRGSWLLLIKGERIMPFVGTNIPGFAVVRGSDYKKNGKWSYTFYRLELASGVRAISGMDGWETGRFTEGLRSAVSYNGNIDTWADVANALGVSVPSAIVFLKGWRPQAAMVLDEVEAQLCALDEEADRAEAVVDMETIVVSFGSPTRRQRSEGFWESPKYIPGYDGTVELVDPSKGWVKENIRVTGVVGTVLSATHASGHGGGYVSVTVAVVPGIEVDSEYVIDDNFAPPAIYHGVTEACVSSDVWEGDAPVIVGGASSVPASLADLKAKFGPRR